MWSSTGLCTGKVRSTPTWKLILRTVKVSRTPSPERPMTTPWKTWMRERFPSVMFTCTLTVSPGAKEGMSERRDAASGQNASGSGRAVLLGDDDDVLRVLRQARRGRRDVRHPLRRTQHDSRGLGLTPQLPQ